MRLITKVAQATSEGWETSFEIVQDNDSLSYLQSLVKKGSFALSFYVEKEADVPAGWAFATEEKIDRRGEVHKVPVITEAGLFRVYKPTHKEPATVSSLRARYASK